MSPAPFWPVPVGALSHLGSGSAAYVEHTQNNCTLAAECVSTRSYPAVWTRTAHTVVAGVIPAGSVTRWVLSGPGRPPFLTPRDKPAPGRSTLVRMVAERICGVHNPYLAILGFLDMRQRSSLRPPWPRYLKRECILTRNRTDLGAQSQFSLRLLVRTVYAKIRYCDP